jgi:hypothetical protein
MISPSVILDKGVKCALTAASSGRTTDDRYRRILVVAARSGEGPFTIPFPDLHQSKR